MINRFRAAMFALAAFATSNAALAHTHLVASTPAANASVVKPTTISLNFNEKVMAEFSGAEVVMTGMPGMANHQPMKLSGLKSNWSEDGKTLTLVAGRAFPVGTYQVTWHAVGADTHRMQGTFTFSVK
ncbi:MAG: copper resistance protein CopC [Sphingomonas sp. 28-62-20]|uniref:copper homeostasis periplasmic binding protein CopC n=1 Tax=Sphingomonas sp. 28-62-20 TaxID=1970433 RepID=UPI000BC48F4B|nr:MAG: copper resistance protein CopC [Sphingomonas sp. 28-62-20]